MLKNKYNRWTLISQVGTLPCKHKKWLCECECGERKIVFLENLKRGLSKSCGCFNREILDNRIKNSFSKNRTYRIWSGINTRCLNKNSIAYKKWYGSKGIKICDRWRSYKNFLKDMGKAPEGMSIDRIDKYGNYEPGNCRWADVYTQQNNTRTNKIIEYSGEKDTMANWCRRLDLDYHLTAGRLNRLGWSIEKAFQTKIKRTTK